MNIKSLIDTDLNIEVTGISYDSRTTKKETCFCDKRFSNGRASFCREAQQKALFALCEREIKI